MIGHRKNVVASVLARLRNVADQDGQSFNNVLQAYVSERFLARLARSPEADTVLLKGALMRRVWGVPRSRPTMDIDLLRRGAADRDTLAEIVRRCASTVDGADGVAFDADNMSVETIHEEGGYIGTRVRIPARLDKVRQVVQIDFGVGDAVYPSPVVIEYPVLLGGCPQDGSALCSMFRILAIASALRASQSRIQQSFPGNHTSRSNSSQSAMRRPTSISRVARPARMPKPQSRIVARTPAV